MLLRQCFDRLHATPNGQSITLPILFSDMVSNDAVQIFFNKISSKQPSLIYVNGFDQLRQCMNDKISIAKELKRLFEFIYRLPVPQIILDFGKIDPDKDKCFLDNIFHYYVTLIYQHMLVTQKLPFISCTMETNDPGFATTYEKYCERLSLGITDKSKNAEEITTLYQKKLGLKYLELAESFFKNSQYQLVPAYLACAKKCFAQLIIPIEIQNKLNKLNNTVKIKLRDNSSLSRISKSINSSPLFDDEDIILDESFFQQPSLTLLAPKAELVNLPQVAPPIKNNIHKSTIPQVYDIYHHFIFQ